MTPGRGDGVGSMKRRIFTKAFLFGLICGPAFAADPPLPTLQETPMFAEEVKSGALPPVAKRVPQPPWVVTKFAGVIVVKLGPHRHLARPLSGGQHQYLTALDVPATCFTLPAG